MSTYMNLNGGVLATSVYAAGNQIGVNVHVTLPEVTPSTTELTASGGTLELPIYSKIEAMTATVTKTGIDSAWLKSLKPEPCDLIVNIVQQSLAADGTTNPVHLKAYLRAIPKLTPSIDATYGEAMEQELTFSVLSYRLTINGSNALHIDPVKGIYNVNGYDYNSRINAML